MSAGGWIPDGRVEQLLLDTDSYFTERLSLNVSQDRASRCSRGDIMSSNQRPMRIELPEPKDERKEQLDRYKDNVKLGRYILAQYGRGGRTPIPEAAWETMDKILNDPALRKKGGNAS
jgi:hypothetical protein